MKTVFNAHKTLFRRCILPLSLFIGSFLTTQAYSLTSDDVDTDNDGLIEIATLAELNQIRYNLNGTGLTDEFGITNSNGCPETGCFGYELVNSLDFDLSRNGSLEDDEYWNAGQGWVPIGSETQPFSAVFEGNDKAIINLHINRPDEDYVGLFGVVGTAELRNLRLNGANYSVLGRDQVGGLVGGVLYDKRIAITKISNIANTGTVTGRSNVGGIVGTYNSYSDVTLTRSEFPEATVVLSGNTFSGTLGGFEHVGGIAGSIVLFVAYNSKIMNNRVNAEISGTDDIGGLIGTADLHDDSDLEVTDNRTRVTVTGHSRLGGLLGSFNHLDPFCDSLISSNAVSARNFGSGDHVGGLIGYFVTYSDSRPELSKNSTRGVNTGLNYVGGFIGGMEFAYGANASVLNNYSSASAWGTQYVGGLLGYLFIPCGRPFYEIFVGIENVYTTGKVEGDFFHGGLIGYFDGALCEAGNEFVISEAYWDLQTSQQSSSDGGEGYSTRELKCPRTPGDPACPAILYQNWSPTIWNFGSERDYPRFYIK